MPDRIDKINDEVLKILSQAVRSLKDPRLDGKFFTLTRAEVSRDFSYAKIHVSVMEGETAQKSVIAGLSSAAGLLRRELGRAVVLHKTPEISFVVDNSLDYSERINKVLDEVITKNDDV